MRFGKEFRELKRKQNEWFLSLNSERYRLTSPSRILEES